MCTYLMLTLFHIYLSFQTIKSQVCTGDCDAFGRTCRESGTCSFSCFAPASCTLAKFNCNKNATCTISCTLAAACNTVTVHAETAKSLTFIADAEAAAAAVEIYCPDNGPHGAYTCFLNAKSELAIEQFQGVKVYAIEGFKDAKISNCNIARCGTMTMHGCGPTYHTHKCDIDVQNYSKCAENDNGVCEHYLPTFSPTISPTFEPTTKSPTNATYSPTYDPTMNPTLSIDERKEWTNVSYIVLSVLMMFVIGFLTAITIYKFFKKPEGKVIMKRIRYLALIQMIAFFFSYFFW
eukprot:280417_1